MRTNRPRSGLSRFLPLVLLALLCGCNATAGRMSNRVGTMHYNRGHYAAARWEFHRAVLNEPDNADHIHNLAMAMRKQGDVIGAEQVLRRAVQVDPAHQPSYHSLASLMHQHGRTAEAHALLDTWANAQPYTTAAHIELAWLQRETGDLAGAEQSLRTALRQRPNHPVALAHLGQLYQETGRPRVAVAMYQRSLYADWDQPQVQSRLARLRPMLRGNAPTAVAALPAGWGPAGSRTASAPTPVYVQQPTAAYASTVVIGPRVTAAKPPQPGSPLIPNADPAHAPQVTAEHPPVVQPH